MLEIKYSERDSTNVSVHLFLVGDRFKSQVPDPRIISVTELFGLILWLVRAPRPVTPIHLWSGQGVTDEQVAQIRQSVASHGLESLITLAAQTALPRASALLTHKHLPANILITEPQQVATDSFLAALLIDERCDDIHDHLTGQHIPGMLIIEAARQMVLAVSEKFIVSAQHRGAVSYVTHRQTVDFIDFIFPLDINVVARTSTLRRSGAINFQATFSLDFIQCAKICAHSDFTLSGFDRRVLSVQERHQADVVIGRSLMLNHGPGHVAHDQQAAVAS